MAGDASYPNVSLLLNFDGSNGATTFTDGSKYAHAVSQANGTSTSLSNTQSEYGGTSASFTGAGNLQVPYGTEFAFGSGDFTMEGWGYRTVSADKALFSCRANSAPGGWAMQSGGLRGKFNGVYSDTVIAWTLPSQNAWHHYVLCCRSGTLFVLIDGVLAGTPLTMTSPMDDGNTTVVSIGAATIGGENAWTGYLDDVVLTKGVARYTTAGFTMPRPVALPYAGQVSGTVTDASGANASRIVRAYRRDTGALVGSATSDGTTGAYSINAPTFDEVSLIVLDNATSGTIYNDLIDRVIPA